ncbi:MAG: helix-turn-helix domain-containing protein [Butyricicoccus sp.]|jgi:transcriptional regulator with XRE-family HTH domain
MNVGKRIFEYLKQNGISQTHISKESGIPLPKLNLALNGKRRLTFEEYEEICWVLGVSVDQFLSPRKPNNEEPR